MDNRLLIHLTIKEFEEMTRKVVQETFRQEMKNLDNNNVLLNVQEAASLLNLAVNTIYEKTSEKLIPFYKHGKKIMFKKSELLAWVESRRVKTIREIRQEASNYQLKTKSDKV
jgi:excisionase family DNA binding protein